LGENGSSHLLTNLNHKHKIAAREQKTRIKQPSGKNNGSKSLLVPRHETKSKKRGIGHKIIKK
jgi:hypothetical protein